MEADFKFPLSSVLLQAPLTSLVLALSSLPSIPRDQRGGGLA